MALSSSPKSEWLSSAQVAEFLGLSVRAARRLLAFLRSRGLGRLGAGRGTRYRRVELERYLDDHAHNRLRRRRRAARPHQ